MENNKNIWLLPTNEPSMFHTWINEKGLRATLYEKPQLEVPNTAKNIYITSDEEIKEGDWFYDLDTKYVKIKQSWENSHLDFNGKKIILTTDTKLIADGIQPIPDDFLEWFVKNSSCERVDVDYRYDTNLQPILDSFGNKVLRIKIPTESEDLSQIIIPQEEPKQETLSWDELVQEAESKEELIKILKLPHIAPLVREAMRNNCKK
jgi:hypothetical protein